MSLFRSEEHLEAWLGGRARGGTIPVTTLGVLARAWFGGRLDANWKPRTREENQNILEGLGLTGEFWRLP
jgi:hypothetical protein